MMDNSDDIHLVSLPGAEDTEPTTILEELNRNLIDAVVTQAADNDANENERAQNVNVDNVTNATDVGESSQLTEIQSEVTNQVNQDNNQTVDAEKLCDNDRFDGIEILNFTLQTVDDAQTDEKPNRTETIDEVDRICEEDKDRDNVVASSNDLKSDSKPSTSSHDNTGSLQREVSPPPVPLVTYRWEDVRRDKQKVRFEEGGYPWTYLDPHEPRPVALNKDSSEGEQYRELEEPGEVKLEESKDLRDLEEIELSRPEVEIDFEEKLDFEPVSNEPEKPPETKTQRTLSFLKRALPSKKLDVQKANQSPSSQPLNSPTNSACCHPLVEKLKTMADKQLHKAKQYRAIKKHPLRDDERIELSEPHQILKLKESPKADRKEIASYVVKQDSDDVLEIIDLDESPSEIRRHREEERSTIVSPDEIIELPLSQETTSDDKKDAEVIEPTVTEVLETEVKRTPPPKSPRKQKEHVYEEIDQPPQNDPMENDPLIDEFISNLSLRKEENEVSKSEDEVVPTDPPVSSIEPETEEDQNPPTSTVKSTLDVDNNKVPLSESQKESDEITQDPSVKEKSDETKEPELKSLLKREASPCSDKKVTFSMSTDDNSDEPHREDVDLPEHVKISSKWSKMSDHEYEPIGESNDTAPVESTTSQDLPSQHESKTENQEDASSITSHERKLLGATNTVDEEGGLLPPEHIEEEILAPTPQTDHSRNDEICTSQIDSSAIEDLPLRREDRKKSFMASTSDKTRNVQRKLSKQADRLKSKFKEMQKPKEEDSPKSERKRFRSPEFNKLKNIKMPKISKPELKRPEFTKFKKPDFKFTKPEILKKYDGFSSLRLNRKKSTDPTESLSDESKITRTTDDTVPTKKRFDFGTYPRLFDRMRRDNRSGASGTTISRDTEPEEECDRVNTSGPVLFSTVPRSKKEKNKKPVRPQWAGGPSFADDESSSGKFKHYSLDRESSIEKRMRFDFKDSIDDDEGERGILQTEEQKQYADYDKENRAIHQISKAKEGEFRQRRPLVHQESDVVSEESNRELGWVDTDHLRDRLMAHSGDLDISQREDYVNEGLQDKDHVSTQETQSSGSSSNRRRKGVIEEIDDDEFFLRKKGISQDDIQIGKYISAAIREGLDTPVNALAQLTQRYEPYYDEDFDISNERVDYGYDVPPRKPRRVRDFEKSLSSEFNDDSGMMPYNNEADHDEDRNISPDGQFFRTYPPSRPRRKARKQQSEESQEEHEVPVAAQYYPHPDEDDHSFYENKHMEGIEQPDIKVTYNEEVNLDTDYATNQDQAPPKAPKRRKHLLRESVERDSLANNFVGRSVSNSYLTNENAEETVVFRTEHEYVPLVQPETFTTPTPTPRSRSKASPFTTDDDRTSRGAESLAFDDTKPSTDVKEANGYAVVKKEPPPRPPAPMRRKRSTRSLGDRQFFTMPLRRNQNDLAPERPVRNYSTIGPTRPIRPARRVSLNSLEKPPSITSDATQYEEIEDINHSGNADHKVDQNYKMKHRPLPPPPRPPRERKHRKSSESDGNKLDKDGGGEKITSIKNVLGDISRISSEEMEEIEEMERSTQTDPLPDDYLCEEFDINSDMPIIEPSFNRHSKTLEDILKEEQQAEMERARQIADENSLTKGIQKFREANQRSLSERSRGSTNDRPKTPSSRPITPSAVVIEKKTNLSTIETDAQLIVQPVDEVEINTASNIPYRNRFFPEDTVDTEDERIVNEALKRYNLLDSDFRDSSPQQDIELNIREVEPPIQTQTTEVLPIPPQETPPLETPPQEIPPQAPPRRKSSCAESTVVPIATECDENVPIPEEDRTDVESPTATMNLLPGNRLHINELEVEHLNVHDLQAGRILVSDLQAIAIASQDIECTSGDLTVKGIKIPASFLEELINRSRTTAIEEHYSEHEVPNQLTQEPTNQQTPNVVPLTEQNVVPTYEPEQEPEPPARPPPPRSLYTSDYAQYSLPPPSFYQLRSYPDEIEEVLPHSPTTTHRQRRRYHRRRDTTSEEEEQREHRRSRQHNNRSPEPSIGDLSGQLIRACGSAIGRGGVKLYSLMKEKKQEMKRRDVSIGVAILIFVVAFLMMIGIRGERTVHHHHWDYWNPPGSSGRP